MKTGRKPQNLSSLIGIRYNKLVLIADEGMAHNGVQNKPIGRFLCDCGKEKVQYFSLVKNNRVVSCGCHRGYRDNKLKHGLSRTQLYRVWSTMKQRCYNTNAKNYKRWGGKGVFVCAEWRCNFELFYNWCIDNGWVPGLQLDKDIKAKEMGILPIEYSPAMCKIVTPKENASCRGALKQNTNQ